MKAVRQHLSYANVVATLALFIALGGGAWAASTSVIGGGGMIHGCVPKSGGLLTVVSSGRKCRRGQQAISFNRIGPKGQPGSQGSQGLQGLQGAQGPPGPATGAAGGALSGTYPNPTLATGVITDTNIKPNSLTGASINANTLGKVPSSSSADNASMLSGLTANQFVQGGGASIAGRATLVEGGGGFQHIVTVPGFGEVVGGCGSGGAAVGFVNHFGHDLRVYPFAGSDLSPVTFSDGTSSGLFPPGFGSAGMTLLQIGSTDFTDQRLVTIIATRDAQVSGQCGVQAWAVTR